MPAFTFTSPEGKSYTVNGPDGATQDQAFQILQQQLGGQQQPSPPQSRSILGQLTGSDGGERFQTWPERMVRDVLSVPQRAAQESENLRTTGDFNPGPLLDAAALASPMSVARRAGEFVIPGLKNAFTEGLVKKDIPSTESLKATGGAQIEQARNMGVEFKPEAVQSMGAQLETTLQNAGANDLVAPETFGILAKLRSVPEGAVSSTFGNLQNLREQLGSAAASTDAREKRAATLAIRELDKFLGGDIPPSALAGSATPEAAAQAAAIYKTGRGNYAAGMRSDDVTGRAEAADLRAAVSGSGHNIDNLTRQRFVDILTNDAKGRGYSPEALDQVETLARGSKAANTARNIGNYFGGGGGLGQNVATGLGAAAGGLSGLSFGGPTGAAAGAAVGATIPAIVGSSAKALANAITTRAARKIDEQVRKESPLYRNDPGSPTYPAANDAIVRALLQMQFQPQR